MRDMSIVRNSFYFKLLCLTVLGCVGQVHDVISNQMHYGLQNSTLPNQLRRMTRSTHTKHTRQMCAGCDDTSSGQCSRKLLFRVKRYSERLKCQPGDTLVRIQGPSPSYSVEPILAKVKRCKGYCRAGFHSCLPTQTSFIKVPAIITNHGTGFAKCVQYEIEQHEKCACDCEILPEHCPPTHKHEMCSCRCKNEEEKYKCLENINASWDDNECQCNCEIGTGECSNGQVWDAVECRCKMVSPNDLDNMLY